MVEIEYDLTGKKPIIATVPCGDCSSLLPITAAGKRAEVNSERSEVCFDPLVSRGDNLDG